MYLLHGNFEVWKQWVLTKAAFLFLTGEHLLLENNENKTVNSIYVVYFIHTDTQHLLTVHNIKWKKDPCTKLFTQLKQLQKSFICSVKSSAPPTTHYLVSRHWKQ